MGIRGLSTGLRPKIRGQSGFRSFSNTPSSIRPKVSGASRIPVANRKPQNFRGFANPAQQRSFQGNRAMPQQSFRGGSAPQPRFSAPRQSAPQGGGGGFRGGGGASGVVSVEAAGAVELVAVGGWSSGWRRKAGARLLTILESRS